MQRHPGGLFHSIQFIVVGLAQRVVGAVLYDHVARGACAASAAAVLQLNSKIQRDIQNGFGLSMMLVGQFPGLKLDRTVDVYKLNFRHTSIVSIELNPEAISSEIAVKTMFAYGLRYSGA